MKTTLKTVTRAEALAALNTANSAVNRKHPNTKLAAFCRAFIKENIQFSKAHNRLQAATIKNFERDLELLKVTNALEIVRDGVSEIWKDKNEKGEVTYHYDKVGEKTVMEASAEIMDKMTKATEEFMDQEVQIICLDIKLKLPEDITPELDYALNGYAYNNPSLFEITED